MSLALVQPDASFVDDLGADSLHLAQLVMAIEEAFSIAIPDQEAARRKTVGQAIDYVYQRKPRDERPSAR